MTLNLTTPPPVDDLDPARHDELRSGLVALAGEQTRAPSRPAWPPIVAAAAAVATVVAAVVTVSQLRDASPQPPGPSGTSSTSTQAGPTWTAPPTGVLDLDLGPASAADARKASRWCFAPDDMIGFKPGDGDKAVHHWSRWMLAPYTYRGVKWYATPGRQVVQFDTSPDFGDRLLCTLAEHDRFAGGAHQISRAKGPLPSPGGDDSTAFECNLDRRELGRDRLADGRWLLRYKYLTMGSGGGVGRVELRIAWPGGATKWHRGYISHGVGYVEAFAAGNGTPPRIYRAEVRAYDAAGNQICETFA